MDTADALKVNKAGDTMTGNLTIPSLTLNGASVLTGNGFPQGVVSASVGSIYIDTAVTNGASSWIKKSGTGNTGWSVLEGDTGWRNITSLANNITSGGLLIRRIDAKVIIGWADVVTPAGTSTLYTMPSGFQPVTPPQPVFLNPLASNTTEFQKTFVTSTGQIQVIGRTLTNPIVGQNEFAAGLTQPWPSVLPGVAA